MSSYNEQNRAVCSCALQNDSDSDAHVVFIYKSIPDRKGEMKQTRAELDVPKGQKKSVYQRLVTRETGNIIEIIERIEVTRANGTKLELKAPFAGVKSRVTDWLFVMNNTEIKSVGPGSK